MQLPVNAFKQGLRQGATLYGLWVGLADAYVAELLASTGFDWLLIDGEHAPNNPRSVLPQLQAVAPYSAHPIVRPVSDDTALIKQYLDLGAQTLLVPMVDCAQQAARVVAATRYPPRGVRGVGSALARASRWNQIDAYLRDCERELCVLVQAESTTAVANLAEIAAVEGVDGVFFGPSDLSASMGLIGQANDPRVKDAVANGIRTVRQAGKAAGVLATDATVAKFYIEQGAQFVGVGVDTSLLVRAASTLAAQYKQAAKSTGPSSGGGY